MLKLRAKCLLFCMYFQLYVEDSLGDRVWVDHEDCAGFVNNILTAINSRILPRSMLQPDLVGLPGSRGESCPSPSTVVIDEEGGEGSAGSGETGMSADIKEKMDIPIVPRQVVVSQSISKYSHAYSIKLNTGNRSMEQKNYDA